MKRMILAKMLIILVITLIVTSCEKTTNLDYRNFVIEKDHSNEIPIALPNLKDRLLEEYVANKTSKVVFENMKVSKIEFKLLDGELMPVESGRGNSVLTLYNIYGYNASNDHDVILGIYEWNNYPYTKKKKLDRFIIRINFDIAVSVHEAMFSYDSSQIENVALALFNDGYIWDIPKDEKKHPSAGVIYMELKEKKIIPSNLLEYRYNSSENYFDDTKENSDTIIIENLIDIFSETVKR